MNGEMSFFNKPNDILDNTFFAIQAKNYISYSGLDEGMDFDQSILILKSNLPTPEERLIKKDFIASLSKDANWLVYIIFNEPDLCSIKGKGSAGSNITKRSLYQFLIKKKKWNRLKIQKIFDEIKLMLRED
jgi:putative ribosome biogenesis GTPase RsgA